VDWYNEILTYASFDFVQEGEEVEEAEEDTPGEDAAND
jgi:hypothetical protein